MSESLPDLVRAFDRLHVLVIGDAILDSYLVGDARRLCREAPVPIVQVDGRRDAPGAANTAANVRSLGARVTLLSVVGEDAEGEQLHRVLAAHGVDAASLVVDACRTRVKVHKRQGRRVVFTNGCFDILHRGHITYLNRAKALGTTQPASGRAARAPPRSGWDAAVDRALRAG